MSLRVGPLRRQGVRRAAGSSQRGPHEQGVVQGLPHPDARLHDGPAVYQGSPSAPEPLWSRPVAMLRLLH